MQEKLLQYSKPSSLWKKEKNALRCLACGHRCLIKEGRFGICRVRSNQKGELLVPWGYVSGLQIDPIEKKPFFHVLPGSKTLSFGMLGCNYHCAFCQNWISSQTFREKGAGTSVQKVLPDEIIQMACSQGAGILTSTYNEPFISLEWAADIFKCAKASGLKTAFVSNGYATREALEYIRPYLDFMKVDLKSFSDKSYRKLGGVLKRVLDTIQDSVDMGFWIEIVTLLVPGFNDDPEEIRDLVRFIKKVCPSIPWHVTAFHPDFKMGDRSWTSAQNLQSAGEIGREEGLQFVYVGNLHGMVGDWESTFCPQCKERLVVRKGFRIYESRMQGNECPSCGVKVPGVWV